MSCISHKNKVYEHYAICGNTEICSESQMCMKHCESKNHFHCVTRDCDSMENFCEKNAFTECIKHCGDYDHGHCSNWCSKTTNLCKESRHNECIMCCGFLDHTHPLYCKHWKCGETLDVCKKCTRCCKHCEC